MTTSCVWFIFFTAAALAGSNSPLSLDLHPKQIQPGERAHLRLLLEHHSNEEIEIQINDKLLLEASHIQILGKSFDPDSLTWNYEITSYEPGSLSIPPIEITAGPQSFSTELKTLEVLTTRKEGDFEIRPSFGEETLPSKTPWILYTSILFIGALLWVLYKRKKPQPVELPLAVVVPTFSDWDWLRQELHTLKLASDKDPHNTMHLETLNHLIKEFFKRRTGHPTHAWTTKEFKRFFSEDLSAQEISKIFEACDEAKYNPEPSSFYLPEQLTQAERILLP